MARFADSRYSIAWRKCQGCGSTGYGLSFDMMRFFGTKVISVGVGLPVISERMPISLWKQAVLRTPPFHQFW